MHNVAIWTKHYNLMVPAGAAIQLPIAKCPHAQIHLHAAIALPHLSITSCRGLQFPMGTTLHHLTAFLLVL
jgi:hypothetical protein